jgi:branched-chain amino acid transport system substrate-binding protein
MKAGILFPLSQAHPGTGLDFMDGLQSVLNQQQILPQCNFIKEGIGFGGTEKEVYQKAEKLLISEEADILIAWADEKVLPILYPLVQAVDKILLVVNPGANYPLNWIAQPNVIHLNLQHAFLCRLTGALAAQKGNGNAALATTYYDCGYLHAAAMVNHFLQSGGSIRYNYINNQPYNEAFEINQLTGFLSGNTDCQNLLCVMDELPAKLFYQLLQQYQTPQPLHLFVSPMMLQPGIAAAALPFYIDGYLPWHAALDTPVNNNFIKNCRRPATIFSLLGWETGLVLQQVLQGGAAAGSTDEMIAGLKNNALQSPRGTLQLDDETQFYTAPVIRCSKQPGQAAVFTGVDTLENEWRQFTAVPVEGAVTGWTNTYLCY